MRAKEGKRKKEKKNEGGDDSFEAKHLVTLIFRGKKKRERKEIGRDSTHKLIGETLSFPESFYQIGNFAAESDKN